VISVAGEFSRVRSAVSNGSCYVRCGISALYKAGSRCLSPHKSFLRFAIMRRGAKVPKRVNSQFTFLICSFGALQDVSAVQEFFNCNWPGATTALRSRADPRILAF
jgi:hypothetical protein